MLTAKEISGKKFEKSKGFGGYRIDDVEDFMDRVAEYVTAMENERADLEKKMTVLAEKLEEYRSDEDSLRTALLGAQKLGDGVIRESKTKAEIILRDAAIKADKIINDAHTQLGVEERKLAQTKRDASAFKNQLIELYRQHLTMIDNMPSFAEPQPVAAPIQAQPTQEVKPSEAHADNTMEFDMSAAVVVERAADRSSRTDADTDDEISNVPEHEPDAYESKYGPIKFGDKFSLSRTDDPQQKRRK